MDFTKKGDFYIYPLLFLLFSFSLMSQNLLAQDAGEIQVYASSTTPKYMTIIELHSNYTFLEAPNLMKNTTHY